MTFCVDDCPSEKWWFNHREIYRQGVSDGRMCCKVYDCTRRRFIGGVVRCLSAFKLLQSSTAMTSVRTHKAYAVHIKRNTYNIQKREHKRQKMYIYIFVFIYKSAARHSLLILCRATIGATFAKKHTDAQNCCI